jgi:hypothetical protein
MVGTVMSDTNCPYCGAEIEINHDDGYGYEEDLRHEQECHACEKMFVFTTYTLFNYTTFKADCLNGSDHKLRPSITYPRQYTRMECVHCDYHRACTPDELRTILEDKS